MSIKLPMIDSSTARKLMARKHSFMLFAYLFLVFGFFEMKPSSSEESSEFEPSDDERTFSYICSIVREDYDFLILRK